MSKTYKSVKTGNILVVKPDMFFWRGSYFTGLVDEEANALYDNPEDSFAEHVGTEDLQNNDLIEEMKQKENKCQKK